MNAINYSQLLDETGECGEITKIENENENAPSQKRKKRNRNSKKRKIKTKKQISSNIFLIDLQGKSSLTNYHLFIAKINEIQFNTNIQCFVKGRNRCEQETIPEGFDIPDEKFWNQRYYYYSKFDEGIHMDKESWYSVTPEEISIYIAKKCQGKAIVDAFCGSGGNTIQFSKFGGKVYAIDIDPQKIELCKNNCRVYQCDNNIEFIESDFLTVNLNRENSIDCVFLSPPWGGVEYKDQEDYVLKKWISPDIHQIIRKSLEMSDNLIFYLPRNTNIEELFTIVSECIQLDENDTDDPTLFAEVLTLKSANKIKALLVLIGNLFNQISIKDLRKYLAGIYHKANEYQICQLIHLAKIIGVSKFILEENNFRRPLMPGNNKTGFKINKLIKHLIEEVMTKEEIKEYNLTEKVSKKKSSGKILKFSGEVPNFRGEVVNEIQYENLKASFI